MNKECVFFVDYSYIETLKLFVFLIWSLNVSVCGTNNDSESRRCGGLNQTDSQWIHSADPYSPNDITAFNVTKVHL